MQNWKKYLFWTIIGVIALILIITLQNKG